MVVKKLLEVKDLSIGFKNRFGEKSEVVKSISFSLVEGQCLAIVGESGSGKTITGLSIAKLLPSNQTEISGQVTFAGRPIHSLNEDEMCIIRGRDIGLVFQEPMTSLNPLHTIGKQIGEVVKLHGIFLSQKAIRARVVNLLHMVGMSDFIDKTDYYPHQLSGGQKQRVMIAIAIANNPKLLIADEPTTALDIVNSQKILDLIKNIKKELGLSMIFISHDLDVVRQIADEVCVMKSGEIVEYGLADEVLKNPQHEYTKFLLNAEPKKLIRAKKFEKPPILDIKNLQVSYQKKIGFGIFKSKQNHILNGINLQINAGETVGIVGESGSGKTTLAMAMLKLIDSKGQILIDSVDINTLKKEALRTFRKNMQIVFQDPFASLNPRFNVFDIIAEGPRAQNIFANEDEIQQEVLNVLAEVGLDEEFAKRLPHELSGGQRQRVAIGRALIMKPKFLILDEPTSALDKPTQKMVLQLLYELQKSKGLSYLLISHDKKVMHALSHRIFHLEKGELIAAI